MPTAALQGSLSSFRLPEVLTFLATARKSGTLTVATDGQESYVYFDQGTLIYAGSNQEQFRLGNILLRKRKITAQQRERIDELMRRDGGRFGQLAVQQGILTEAQLRDFLKVQVSEIVYDCFVWAEGTFWFAEETVLPQYAVTINIDLTNLIMEGSRRIEEWEQCARLLPDRTAVFRVVAAPKDEKVTLTADEWKILFLINGVRTLEELCHDAEDDSFGVYRIVYGLLSNKLIEPVTSKPSKEDTQDATVRQSSPVFHAETTMRDPDDDTSLLVSSDAKLSYAEMVRPTIAQLSVAEGEGSGTIIPLVDPDYSIGRHRDNAIQLLDLGISGFHARIFRAAEGYVIEDLKSRNGTWLNGSRVFHATLKSGDTIRIGGVALVYEILFDPRITIRA
ncbi:MAG TPA: DUF4388 domain-containing protein [Thermoanaerobaculia bacterium]|jgi:hypothetical protein